MMLYDVFVYFNMLKALLFLCNYLFIYIMYVFKALMFAYRTTSGSAPLYLNSLLQTYMPSRSLRSASERRISVHPKKAQNPFHGLFH